MKKLRLLPILFCTLLVSCNLIDFSEDCIYDGNIDIRLNWNYLLEGDEKPGLTSTWIYTAPIHFYDIHEDTILTKIPEGTHTLLAVSKVKNLETEGMDNILSAAIQLPVIQKDGKDYIGQAPLVYADSKNINVQAGKTSLCEFIPRSCVQQVILDFIIPDNGVALEVEKITGDLSGVQSGYSFKQMQAIPSSAYLSYNARVIKEGVLRSSNFVFGMNPHKDGINAIENTLNLDLRLNDGSVHSSRIDLTRQFDGFLSPIITITIEIRLGLMGMETEIVSWATGEEGNIEI